MYGSLFLLFSSWLSLTSASWLLAHLTPLLALTCRIRSKKNFEVVQAYLHRFLKHYSDLIIATPDLRQASKLLRDEQEESSKRIKQLVQHSLCLVGYLSNLQS